MSIHAVLPSVQAPASSALHLRNPLRPNPLHNRRGNLTSPPIHFPPTSVVEDAAYHQAELFYLQKQIQSQTPMVVVLEDGEHVEGCIEWYDRNCLKIRGRSKTLVYKSAIKYMYKLGEQG